MAPQSKNQQQKEQQEDGCCCFDSSKLEAEMLQISIDYNDDDDDKTLTTTVEEEEEEEEERTLGCNEEDVRSECYPYPYEKDKKIKRIQDITTRYSSDDLKSYIPKHLKNSFIETGYRINLSFTQATLTLFTIHNETMNIWTALVPFLVFLGLGVFVCVWDLLQMVDRIILLVYIIGALISFGGSTAFHWYGCGMCEKINSMTIRLDYAGIAALVGSSFIPPIYYSFYCHTFVKLFYLITIGTLSAISFCLFVLPPAKYNERLKFLRISAFVLIAGFGVVPIIHILIREGFSRPETNLEIGLIFVTWSIYGIGVFFYASKVPERIWPGKFDIWFHSHQLWHIWVFLGTLSHCINCIAVVYLFYSYERNICTK